MPPAFFYILEFSRNPLSASAGGQPRASWSSEKSSRGCPIPPSVGGVGVFVCAPTNVHKQKTHPGKTSPSGPPTSHHPADSRGYFSFRRVPHPSPSFGKGWEDKSRGPSGIPIPTLSLRETMGHLGFGCLRGTTYVPSLLRRAATGLG